MEIAESVEWFMDSRDRFIERAIELEIWGNYEGLPHLGRRLISEVDNKIQDIKKNLNLYSERENAERVVPLFESNHVLIYKKAEVKGRRLLMIIDMRRFY